MSRKQAISADLKQARDVLLCDQRVLKSKVRTVAARGDQNGHALCLYTCAAGHKFNWTPDDWNAVLERLDSCELTVLEWLDPCPKSKSTYHYEDNQGMCHECGKPMIRSNWETYAGAVTDQEWQRKIDTWNFEHASDFPLT
jgi:hypothetical protein